jgi:hypothetical protein
LAGKRQKDPELPRIAGAFVRELREASGDVIHDLSIEKKIPLKQVYEGHVHAAFQMLQMALLARRVLKGSVPAAASGPMAAIRERTAMMNDVMLLVEDELATVDPYHDYSVLIVKREKGSPTLL